MCPTGRWKTSENVRWFGPDVLNLANRPVVPILLFLRIGAVSRGTEADKRAEWDRFQRRLLWFLLCRD
jgi:hypothetical protein